MSDVNTLIDALADGKTSVANNTFKDLMSNKIADALSAKKIEIANRIYNGVQEPTDANIQADAE